MRALGRHAAMYRADKSFPHQKEEAFFFTLWWLVGAGPLPQIPRTSTGKTHGGKISGPEGTSLEGLPGATRAMRCPQSEWKGVGISLRRCDLRLDRDFVSRNPRAAHPRRRRRQCRTIVVLYRYECRPRSKLLLLLARVAPQKSLWGCKCWFSGFSWRGESAGRRSTGLTGQPGGKLLKDRKRGTVEKFNPKTIQGRVLEGSVGCQRRQESLMITVVE